MATTIPPISHAELDMAAAREERHAAAARAAWQLKLLPLMAVLLTLASVAFLIVSLLQTNKVRAQIATAPTLTLPPEVARLSCVGPSLTAGQQQANSRPVSAGKCWYSSKPIRLRDAIIRPTPRSLCARGSNTSASSPG